MSNLKFKKNDLFIEKVSVKKLSKKFETPFYCYSSSGIIEKFKEFEKPFKYSNQTYGKSSGKCLNLLEF